MSDFQVSPELLAIYLEDARQHLEALDHCLLTLEREGARRGGDRRRPRPAAHPQGQQRDDGLRRRSRTTSTAWRTCSRASRDGALRPRRPRSSTACSPGATALRDAVEQAGRDGRGGARPRARARGARARCSRAARPRPRPAAPRAAGLPVPARGRRAVAARRGDAASGRAVERRDTRYVADALQHGARRLRPARPPAEPGGRADHPPHQAPRDGPATLAERAGQREAAPRPAGRRAPGGGRVARSSRRR